jgi:AraC-like DNA-binding protein
MLRNDRTDQALKSARCRVCGHPDRYRYDKAIALGTMTRAEVARELGLHRSSVARHFTHHVEPPTGERPAAVGHQHRR